MPNRYDSPAQAQFMQTYVPVPFQEILQAGLTKQSRADANRMGLEQSVAAAQSFDYIPNSEDEKYIRNVQTNLEDIRDKYLDMDYDNPEVVRNIYKDIRAVANRDNIDRIRRSAEGYKQYQQLAAKATSEGKSLFHPYDFTGYSTENRGIFAELPEPLHDWRKKQESYFDQIEPDSYTDKNTGETFAVVNKQKVLGLAQAGLQDYVNSTEGRQELRNYINQGGDPNQAQQYMLESLYKVGLEKLQRQHQAYMPEYMASGADQVNPLLRSNIGNTQRLQNPNITPDKPLKGTPFEHISYDDKGNINEFRNYEQSYTPPTALQQILQTNQTGQYVAPMKFAGVDKNTKKDQLDLLETIRKSTYDENGFAPYNLADNKTLVNILEKARVNKSAFDNDKALIDNPELAKKIGINTDKDMKSRVVYTTESDRPLKITTTDQLYKALGVKREQGDYKAAISTVPSRGTIEMAIMNQFDEPKATYEVGMPNNLRAEFEPYMKAHELSLKGIPGVQTYEVNGKKYGVVTAIKQVNNNGALDYVFVHSYGEMAPESTKDNPRFIKGTTKSLDQAQAEAVNQLRILNSIK